MLPETSNARMTVPSIRGRLTTVCGRASATMRIVRPIRKRMIGIWRRAPEPPARRLLTKPEAAVSRGQPSPPPLHPKVQHDAQRNEQQEQQASQAR